MRRIPQPYDDDDDDGSEAIEDNNVGSDDEGDDDSGVPRQANNAQPADGQPEKIIYSLPIEEMKEEIMVRDFVRYRDWFQSVNTLDGARLQQQLNHHMMREVTVTHADTIQMRRRKDACFFCTWGNISHDSLDSSKVQSLFAFFYEVLGNTDDHTFAKLVKLYYDHEFYNSMKENDKRIPELLEVDVMMHIRHHMMDPRIWLWKKIAKIDVITDVLADKTLASIRAQGEDLNYKNVLVDTRLIASLEKMLKMGVMLYTRDTSKMLFRLPNDIDLSQKKAFVNVLKSFKFRDK